MACYVLLAVICGQRVAGKAKRPRGGANNPGLRGRHDWLVTSVVTWGESHNLSTPSPIEMQ